MVSVPGLGRSHALWSSVPTCRNYWVHALQLLKPEHLEPVLRNKGSHSNLHLENVQQWRPTAVKIKFLKKKHADIYITSAIYSGCLVTQLCPAVCDPMDCGPPGSFVLSRISQAKILEWVDILFSRGSSWPRDWTCISFLGRWLLYAAGDINGVGSEKYLWF